MTDTGFAAAADPENSTPVISGTPPSPWQKTRLCTEAEGAEALEMLAAGKTFGVVAARFGISRNAAIGRVYRMQDQGLAAKRVRVKTPVEKRQQAQKRPPRPMKPPSDRSAAGRAAHEARWGEAGYRPAPLPRPDAPPTRIDAFAEGYMGQTGRVSIYDLGEAQCRFPIDQPPPEMVKYCGLARVHGSPYCENHYRRVTRTD